MPTFCRHNRFAESCPICAKAPRTRSSAPSVSRRPDRTSAEQRAARPASRGSRGSSRGGSVVVRQMARAPDDGFHSELVPGLRSTVDAQRLAEELAFAVARLDELSADPPGLYAEAALAEDREEAAWLCFLIAWLSPLEGEDPWAGIRAARVPWASGELPALDGVELGPRSAAEPARVAEVVTKYRAWAARGGGQVAALQGESSWTPQRRFDLAFERLSLPGFHRAARFEFLTIAGRLGLADLDPWTLKVGAGPLDPVVVAAKRVFGIGDAINLSRRCSDLAGAAAIPVAALDLALLNWSRPDRIVAGSTAAADPEIEARIAGALGLSG